MQIVALYYIFLLYLHAAEVPSPRHKKDVITSEKCILLILYEAVDKSK
jgi:hypothetical protein